ncbi:MAG: hypothetical protein E6J88_09145 [Deltaproteobacteria bacterium]|nr:MAG: hypothetical protein E6J88_09145 [Deltaproteobacteria bacterium]
MSAWRLVLFLAAGAVAAAGATWIAVSRSEAPLETRAAAVVAPPRPVDAAQITTGKLAMERLPDELGASLEMFSGEIVRNAQLMETKQARITGACPPGAAIRVIGEDGSVRCQQFPRGVVAVSAVTAIPRLSTTVTEAAVVTGGSGRYQSGGDDDFLVAPVSLPDGAIVTSFSYTFFDDASEQDTEAYLYRSDDQPLASISSDGMSERVRTIATEGLQLRKIDGRFGYFVYFQTSARAGARLMPISASIAYRLP